MDQTVPDADALYGALRKALRHGARAGQLLTYSHDLINMVCPPTETAGSPVPLTVRAMKTEDIVRAGIAQIGGLGGSALLIVLGLKSGTLDQKLEERRHAAANLLGIQAVTFRRDRHEKALLLNLAIEVYRILSTALRTGQ